MSSRHARLEYARRVVDLAINHPTEFWDRLSGRVDRKRDAGDTPAQLFSDPEGWVEALHRLMGWRFPCEECADFESVWDVLDQTLSEQGPRVGEGFDAGIGLAQAAYAGVRHLRPARVIETGVARGITTRLVLEAMHRNGSGHLFSIDLPPLAEGWHHQSAIAVPDHLRSRWTFVRGATKRKLPSVLDEPVSLFIQDSSHDHRTMQREFEAAWPRLEPGGLLLCDGANRSDAFRDLGDTTRANWIVAKEQSRPRYLGAVRRPHLAAVSTR